MTVVSVLWRLEGRDQLWVPHAKTEWWFQARTRCFGELGKCINSPHQQLHPWYAGAPITPAH